MPAENIRTDNGQGVITKCSGVLTATDFIRAIRERYRPEEALQRIRYYLTDHSDVTAFEMTADDIIKLTRITREASLKNPGICLATVVGDDLGYGIVRMWHGYAHEIAWRYRIFRGREDAEQWLREEVDAGLTFK